MSGQVAIIGFGEAGQAIAAGLRDEGAADIIAWDILFPDSGGTALIETARQGGIGLARSAAEAVRDAELVIAAVTAASSYDAAQSVAPHVGHGPFYLDVNSVSPGRKKATAALFGDSARYVDVAIVSPIHPARHKSPMMLAGPHAAEVAPLLSALGMNTQIVGTETGAAAAIKMVRSQRSG